MDASLLTDDEMAGTESEAAAAADCRALAALSADRSTEPDWDESEEEDEDEELLAVEGEAEWRDVVGAAEASDMVE